MSSPETDLAAQQPIRGFGAVSGNIDYSSETPAAPATRIEGTMSRAVELAMINLAPVFFRQRSRVNRGDVQTLARSGKAIVILSVLAFFSATIHFFISSPIPMIAAAIFTFLVAVILVSSRGRAKRLRDAIRGQ